VTQFHHQQSHKLNNMDKFEIERVINSIGSWVDGRITGNQENVMIAERMESYVRDERQAVIELLRDWIALRVKKSDNDPDYGKKVGALCFSLEMAKRYALVELRPDIEALIADIRAGKTYLPYYADMVANYLKEIG